MKESCGRREDRRRAERVELVEVGQGAEEEGKRDSAWGGVGGEQREGGRGEESEARNENARSS